MRAVDLDRVEAQPGRAPRRIGKGVTDTVEPGLVERGRGIFRRLERQCRGGDGLPAIGVIRRQLRTAPPGQIGRRLAAGMGELDRDRHRRMAAHRLEYAGHRRLGPVVPQADVGEADPPLGLDGGSLDRQQAGARGGKLAQMLNMPVGHRAVLGRILAHGGDDDAVVEGQAADGERLEKLGSGHEYLLIAVIGTEPT